MRSASLNLAMFVGLVSQPCLIVADDFSPSAAVVETSRVDSSSVVDVLAAQTRFVTDGSSLTPIGQRALDDLLDQLVDYERIVAVRIVGHTDAMGKRTYNQRLSLHRARFVKRMIEKRLVDVPISTVGAGESAPIADNATAIGRERNRRVEIRVVAMAGSETPPAPPTVLNEGTPSAIESRSNPSRVQR